MEQRRQRQESREAGQAAHQGLGLDLLPQDHLRVGRQRVLAGRRAPDDGQGSVRKGRREIELLAELCRNEGMEIAARGPAREQVRAVLPQPACT